MRQVSPHSLQLRHTVFTNTKLFREHAATHLFISLIIKKKANTECTIAGPEQKVGGLEAEGASCGMLEVAQLRVKPRVCQHGTVIVV